MFTPLEKATDFSRQIAGENSLKGFKFIDRGKKKSIVLIPGWAFDCRIFNMLNLQYNYFLAASGSHFEVELKETLRSFGIEKISLFGWSQGAQTAYDFACKNPLMIDELILVSIQQQYKKEVLENIKSLLKRNKNAYLIKFYKDCFFGSEVKYFKWFKENLLNDYLHKFKTGALIKGLDRLSGFKINSKLVKNLTIVYGGKDKIANFKKEDFESAKCIILKDSGHLPFVNSDFRL